MDISVVAWSVTDHMNDTATRDHSNLRCWISNTHKIKVKLWKYVAYNGTIKIIWWSQQTLSGQMKYVRVWDWVHFLVLVFETFTVTNGMFQKDAFIHLPGNFEWTFWLLHSSSWYFFVFSCHQMRTRWGIWACQANINQNWQLVTASNILNNGRCLMYRNRSIIKAELPKRVSVRSMPWKRTVKMMNFPVRWYARASSCSFVRANYPPTWNCCSIRQIADRVHAKCRFHQFLSISFHHGHW